MDGTSIFRLLGTIALDGVDGVRSDLQEVTTQSERTARATENLGASYTELQDDVKSSEARLKELKDQYSNVVLQQGKNSDAAKDLKAEMEELNKGLENDKKRLKEAEQASDSFTSSLDKNASEVKTAGESFDELGTKAGELGKNFALGLGALATAVTVGVESTREFRQDWGKLTTTFNEAGASTEIATGVFKEFYGLLGEDDTSIEASNHLAMMTNNEKDLATWTDICTGVYASFGDSLPLEGLTEAANETVKVGQVTGPLADAINWANASTETWNKGLSGNKAAMDAFNKGLEEGMNKEDAFNLALQECNSESEREALLRSTLNSIYSDSSETFKETNATVIDANKAQADMSLQLNETMNKLEPLVTQVKLFLAEMLEKAQPFISWAIENIDILAPLILGFLGTLFALNLVSKVKGFITTIQVLNATMAANPIGLIIIAVGALITILVLLITHWDDVKKAAGKCWDWIKATWEKASNWFNEKVIQPVSKFFTGMWNGLINGGKNAWQGIKNAFSSVADFFGNIFSNAWNKVKSIFSTGGKIFSGITEGIKSAFTNVVNAIIRGINKVVSLPFGFINGTLNKIRNISFLGISPFKNLWGQNPISVPKIPELYEGSVLEKGQTGYLEGNGAEAVVPLHNNKKWISAVADDMQNAIGTSDTTNLEDKLDRLVNLLTNYLPQLSNQQVVLSTGEVVGALVNPMDKALGDLASRKARGY